ncbi:hypothetical protein QFZ22_000689 [Streptomyces canus]|uniref:Transposase IS204/IS1001/IS1096/IS1165 zinc-finger domain-containing protein n=1 Tax=Streptomyces canus TaxID=58343 RepID=A0AAW8F4G2_9ACTN|nr:hypothetical protein [Streptomyces canus]MDQ0904704.1 hypothetical protein [Streptomyces canus]
MSPLLDAVRVERMWAAGGVVHIAAWTRELTVACPDCGRGHATGSEEVVVDRTAAARWQMLRSAAVRS